MSLTPHGPGFSFLDAFEVTVPGREGRGRKRLNPQLPFFADHFPGRPLMPGVLLIECAAQAAGALWASTLAANAPAHFILAQVVQFKIEQPVLPGKTIETDVSLENTLGQLAQFAVTLRVNQVEVARGKLVLSQGQAGG
ncbi:MAG TPA: FabA/FabZ family ACP-dehydratase [Candidatus Methylacidiphilales bacterium]|nr:FabA/FabZ family ACP-dehydratase [Candidatus Methylacidiphilales bacterium]